VKRKGVSYDVGRAMGGNWRPLFDPKLVHRELEIIKNDLHCNAVRICGLDIGRLVTAAEDALGLGPEHSFVAARDSAGALLCDCGGSSSMLSPSPWETLPEQAATGSTS
jgi:hypothetical protein